MEKFLVKLSEKKCVFEGNRILIISALYSAIVVMCNEVPGAMKGIIELLTAIEENSRKGSDNA